MNVTSKVKFETTKGDFIIELYGDNMPITVANFIKHVEADFYSGLIFHRVIKDFVIQGGGMMKSMFEKNKLDNPIKLEIDPTLKHTKYVLSMARTQDPNSATSQFFICTGDVPSLDNAYAAFGKVVEGTEVVDVIEQTDTHSVRHFDDVPVEKIVINSATVV